MPIYFADTSFWLALSRQRDQYHLQAVAWNQSLIRTNSSIVTTEAVLWEWLNAFSDPSVRRVAVEGYRRVQSDRRIEVVPFHPDLIDAAVDLYGARLDKPWGITDCLSFVTMERRQLFEALTTDRHFEQAGFKAVMLNQPPT